MKAMLMILTLTFVACGKEPKKNCAHSEHVLTYHNVEVNDQLRIGAEARMFILCETNYSITGTEGDSNEYKFRFKCEYTCDSELGK